MAHVAWANSRGNDPARLVLAAFFALTSLDLLITLAKGAAACAPADIMVAADLWLIQLTTVVLIFTRKSWPYYRQQPRPELAHPAG